MGDFAGAVAANGEWSADWKSKRATPQGDIPALDGSAGHLARAHVHGIGRVKVKTDAVARQRNLHRVPVAGCAPGATCGVCPARRLRRGKRDAAGAIVELVEEGEAVGDRSASEGRTPRQRQTCHCLGEEGVTRAYDRGPCPGLAPPTARM